MINSISINNFRSYNKADIKLGKNINVFIGKNGQGKTNLLEAIYFVSNIRSHRTKDDLDLIKRGEDFARIIVENYDNEKLVCVIHDKGKYFSINDLAVKTTSEMLGKINTVLFYPTETRLFSDSPAVRRAFFDVEIGKVSKEYTNNFQHFNNLLKDRNRLLKSDQVDEILLDIITKNIANVQMIIIQERKILINYINKHINKYLKKLINKDLDVSIEYRSSVKDLSVTELIERYELNKKRDFFNKVTSEGIHRDDYIIYSQGIEVEKFLSQGQIRIVLLAIKFVLVEYIYIKTKQTPILLLDDVLSELDEDNQINLLNTIPKSVQTIITTTDDYDIFNDTNIKKFKIIESKIVNEEEYNVKY